MDEQTVNFIHGQFPWASEATATSILQETARVDYNKAISVLKTLGVDVQDTKIEAKKLSKTAKKVTKSVTDISDTVKNSIRIMEREQDPLQATTELMGLANQAGQAGAGAIGDLVKRVPGFGRVAQSFGKVGGAAITGTIAVMGLYGQLISEQEKTLRAMVDMGLLASDLSVYNTMRTNAALTGQSLMEQAQHIRSASAMLANIEGDYMRSAYALSNMLVQVEKDSALMGDFGYNTEQLSARFTEEANLLYKRNELNQLDYNTQRRIYQGFLDSSEMATALANITGLERSQILEKRREALESVEFLLAVQQNSAYVTSRFGDEALDNITAVQAYMETTAQQVSPTLAPMLQEMFEKGFANIQFSDNAVNASSQELLSVISLLPGDAQTELMSLFQGMFTGQISENEIPDVMLRVGQLFETGPTYRQVDGLTQTLAQIKAESATSQLTVETAGAQEFSRIMNATNPKAETADDIVDAMDDMRIAMRTTLDTLEPGYDTSAAAVSTFTAAVNMAGEAFSTLFPNLQPFEDRVRQQREERIKREEMQTEPLSRPTPANSSTMIPSFREGADSERPIRPNQSFGGNFSRPAAMPPVTRSQPTATETIDTLETKEREGTITDSEAALLNELRLMEERQRTSTPSSTSVPDVSGVDDDNTTTDAPTSVPPGQVLNGNASQAEFIRHNNQQSYRNLPVSDELGQILANATAALGIPGLQVSIQSGGQRSYESMPPGTRKNTNKSISSAHPSNAWITPSGEVWRLGSTRHDEGDAADLGLIKDGSPLSIRDPIFVRWFEAVFALGATGGSARYMGDKTAHIDIQGSGAKTWSSPNASFVSSQNSGLSMADDENNIYRQRLREMSAPEVAQADPPVDPATPRVNNDSSNNSTANEIASLEQEAAETASRIANKIESDNLGETARA